MPGAAMVSNAPGWSGPAWRQTDEGEAERDDEHFAHVAAWEWTGDPAAPTRHVEPLDFESVALAVRSYK